MVMPRSRSMSIESRIWSRKSRSSTPPQRWIRRSAGVDLPWSMWAMMQKFRMRSKICPLETILHRLASGPAGGPACPSGLGRGALGVQAVEVLAALLGEDVAVAVAAQQAAREHRLYGVVEVLAARAMRVKALARVVPSPGPR